MPVSLQSRSLFSASFQTFCLTARAYLNTQKYGLFCSLPVHWIKTLNLIAADSVTHLPEPVWPALSPMLTDMISDYFISIFVTSCKKYINK